MTLEQDQQIFVNKQVNTNKINIKAYFIKKKNTILFPGVHTYHWPSGLKNSNNLYLIWKHLPTAVTSFLNDHVCNSQHLCQALTRKNN